MVIRQVDRPDSALDSAKWVHLLMTQTLPVLDSHSLLLYIKEVNYIQSCCCGQNLSVFSGIICKSEQMCKIGNVHATV